MELRRRMVFDLGLFTCDFRVLLHGLFTKRLFNSFWAHAITTFRWKPLSPKARKLFSGLIFRISKAFRGILRGRVRYSYSPKFSYFRSNKRGKFLSRFTVFWTLFSDFTMKTLNGLELACNNLFPACGNAAKATLEEWVFVESAFNMQHYIVKNTLHHVAFSAILAVGIAIIIWPKSKRKVWRRVVLLFNLCRSTSFSVTYKERMY